jgi:cytochrome c biogenesis protein CcdA/thiol-disulfide isomerase/thioredoxin
MLLLALFALVAGAATALSPCVLPVLPALLSAGATGGRRRPIGVVLGLAATFTLTIVGLAEVVRGVGLGDTALRDVAIVVLAGFGVALLAPRLVDRLEAPLSRLARFGPRTGGDGFWSGIGVGAALGFVYAPCAGPILAAVISVGAASGRTVLIGASYAIGSAIVLLALSWGGRAILGPLRGPTLQRALGAVMLVTALAMALQLDVRFQETIADRLPAALVNPSQALETSHAARDRLDDLRGGPGRFAAAADGGAATSTGGAPAGHDAPRAGAPAGAKLRSYGNAPEFTGTQRWFNTPGDQPLTLAGLRGRVVLIDFWTYTCINCIRTQPYLKAWDARYRDQGLTIVGVHSPEFSFERDAGNVERAIASSDLRYPVAQDNELATWRAWGNQYWPAEYLIDARGRVRYASFGEGDYDKTEAAIRSLLAEAGAHPTAKAAPKGAITPSQQATPETYLGSERAQGIQPAPQPGTHAYEAIRPADLALNQFTLGGTWDVGAQKATAGPGATLTAHVQAKDVYLVLSPPAHGPGRVLVRVDGGPERTVVVRTQRLYTLAALARNGEHTIALRLAPGTAGYAFTFG